MIKSRLLILARHLEKIAKRPPKTRKFNFNSWFRADDCGTVCCAIGEAMLIPKFKHLGLEMKATNMDPEYFAPRFHSKIGWDAVDAFFELTGKEAENLFSPNCYDVDVGPAEVAGRLREFVGRTKPQANRGGVK